MDLNEIDDLDDDLMNEESPQPDDNQESYEEHPYDDDYQEDNTVTYEDDEGEDVISAFLRSKGINPDSIKFTGDNGEQEEKKFQYQDNFVPWHLQQKWENGVKVESMGPNIIKDEKSNCVVYQRYYHVFIKGELEKLIQQIDNVMILLVF